MQLLRHFTLTHNESNKATSYRIQRIQAHPYKLYKLN